MKINGLMIAVLALFSGAAYAGPVLEQMTAEKAEIKLPEPAGISHAMNVRSVNALRDYPDAFVDMPAIPDVPAPINIGSIRAQAAAPTSDLYAWERYFQQLAGTVKNGGLSDASMSRLALLVDGEEVMNSVVSDINNARSFIHIEIYKLQADQTGFGLRKLLAEKVKAGVRVRVILDQFGSSLMFPGGPAKKLVSSMREAGIEVKVRRFKPLHLDHRKVMVMDDGSRSLVAYTGGMNIGNDYQRYWHDQQTRVTGPATTQLHKSFLDNWEETTGEKLSGFPVAHAVEGGARVRVITHVGGNADQNIKQAYLLAINTARRLIRIEDPYFTDDDIIRALIKAATDPQRPGLKVQLIVPAKNAVMVMLRVFRSHYPDMLKAGIELYEYQPRMAHLKVAVMDHIWATVGSSNLDQQSLKYNNEMNLLVLDENFAAELDARIFDADISQSLRITESKF